MIETAVLVTVLVAAALAVLWVVYRVGWDRGANSMLDLVNALDKEKRHARPPGGSP